MQSIDVVGTLRRGWRLLVALALVLAVVAVLLPASSAKGASGAPGAPKLHWQADTIVGSPPSGGSPLLGGGVTPEEIIYYANTTAVLARAVIDAKVDVPATQLGYYMSAQEATSINPGTATSTTTAKQKKGSGTGLVELIAYGKNGPDAVKLANGYATALGNYINAIARFHAAAQAASSGSGSTAGKSAPVVDTGYQQIVPAYTAIRVKGAKSSITASRKVRLLIGVIVGLLVGAAILLIREALDRHIWDAGAALKAFGYPVVGEIPAPAEGEGDLICPPDSPAAEAYRRLRMAIAFEHFAEAPGAPDELATFFGRPVDEVPAPATGAVIGRRQLVLVASPDSEASRPRLAANLAAGYAESGQSVIVLSTSELPNLPIGALPAPPAPSWDDVEAALAPTVLPGVRRLPLDALVGSSGQLVTRAPALLETLRSVADVTVIETPSLLEVHHAGALSSMVDVVLVVAEVGTTTTDQGAKSGDFFQRLGAPVLGVALTEVGRRDRKSRNRVRTLRSGEGPVPPDHDGAGGAVVEPPQGDPGRPVAPVGPSDVMAD